VAADAAHLPSRFSSMADSLRTAAIYLRERRFATPSRDVTPAADLKQVRHV
jgi:hypothetical protein